MAGKYNIKYFYDIQDRSNFKANPDYKGVCHVALAQVRASQTTTLTISCLCSKHPMASMLSMLFMLRWLQGRVPCGAGAGAGSLVLLLHCCAGVLLVH